MNAWNGDSTPARALDCRATIARKASRKRRTCTTPSRIVRNRPVPSRTDDARHVRAVEHASMRSSQVGSWNRES